MDELRYPWHPQPGKICLSCGEEALRYKYFGDVKKHCIQCEECKSEWWTKKESEAKRQHTHGRTT